MRAIGKSLTNHKTSPQFIYSSQLYELKFDLQSAYVKSKMDSSENPIPSEENRIFQYHRPLSVPVPTTPPSSTRIAEKKYWKLNFRLVLLPFIFLGLPSHLTLLKRPIKTRNEWIKSLANCSIFEVTFVSILTLLCSVALNVYVLRNIVDMFIILVIKGVLDPNVILNFINLVQNLPIIIPINFIWIWGYVVRDLILSFTRPSLSESFLQNPDILQGSHLELPGRAKLILIYVLITLIHTFHIYLYSARAVKDFTEAIYIVEHFVNYFIGPVFSTLILPLYATFCWACHRHYIVLSNYIKTLINLRVMPEVNHFNRFKLAFKELSDRVQTVNDLFSIYFSWIVVNILLSLYVEVLDISDIFFTSMAQPPTNTPAPLFPPEVVRAFTGFVFIVLLKFLLLFFTFWQAVQVNDEARKLNVWLNDLVTEPNATVSVNNYHAFRLLKFYIHSRMQQPLPAILRIPIGACIPVLKNRLNPDLIDQY